MDVKGKVCIVTGSARGIGRSISETLSAYGAKVVYSCDMQDAEFDAHNIEHRILNVTKREEIKKLTEEIIDEHGQIDVLINNAGITSDALLEKMSEEQLDNVINVNLKGVFNMTQAVSPFMIKDGKGSIINLSSVVGLHGNIGQTNYAATKGGVITMTKTWSKEFSRKGAQVRANSIAPGFIKTPMTEKVPDHILDKIKSTTSLRRLGEPEDIANAALFLASDASSFITGQVLSVDGGLVL